MVNVGDTVEFKVTAEVVRIPSAKDCSFQVRFGTGWYAINIWIQTGEDSGITDFRVVPPPVETFKPGDLVRERLGGGVFLLTDTGYRKIGRNCLGEPYPEHEDSPNEFTSKSYEKVEL